MSGKSVEVTIFGKSYPVILNREEDYLKKIAKIVDEKMKEVDSCIPESSSSSKAVLACLNLADDFLSYMEKEEKEKAEIKDNVTSLIKEIDLRLSRIR